MQWTEVDEDKVATAKTNLLVELKNIIKLTLFEVCVLTKQANV